MSIPETTIQNPPSNRIEKLHGQEGKTKTNEVGLQAQRSVNTEESKESVYGELRVHHGKVL